MISTSNSTTRDSAVVFQRVIFYVTITFLTRATSFTYNNKTIEIMKMRKIAGIELASQLNFRETATKEAKNVFMIALLECTNYNSWQFF